MSADAFFQQIWYRKDPPWISLLLLPLSWVFGGVVALRRFAYAARLVRQERLSKPVVVVGNITVGGTGKTPFTIWLAKRLHASGLRVGVVLRGYRAKPSVLPFVVRPDVPLHVAGDEALVIARCTDAIVVIDPDRVRAAQRAIALGADIILSDDGLQHLRLGRDYEIAVIDAVRGLGNGRLLPAGPLRESATRLTSVNRRVVMRRGEGAEGGYGSEGVITVRSILGDARSLVSSARRSLSDFSDHRVHAVAGIGNPNAFFSMLREAGLHVLEHPFPDHAELKREDLAFADTAPVLMTQKDAVRCAEFATERMWSVDLELEVDPQAAETLLAEIMGIAARRSETFPHK